MRLPFSLYHARHLLALLLVPFALVVAGCDSDDGDSGNFFGVDFEETISPGDQLEATLDSSDSRASDLDETITDSSVDDSYIDDSDKIIDVYRLDLDGEAQTISVTSPDFDTVLLLYDLDGAFRALDDDGGEDLNSRLSIDDLGASTYAFVVTSYGDDAEEGAYTLSVD